MTGAAKIAGVIGWPVAHSLSPRLHGYWLAHYNVDGAYLPLPVPPESFAEVLCLLPAMGMAGVNLTIPHKQTALEAVDEIDDVAKRIGAVNTIIVRDDKSLFGTNTDARGFLANLKAGAPAWAADSGPAVLIGAGGAARAIAVALLDAGVPELRIVNRTVARATELADALGDPVKVHRWDDRSEILAETALVVNTTSLGMIGQPALDIDTGGLSVGTVVMDIVYSPLETPFLTAARAAGAVTVDGLGMLLHQAAPGFAAWFGVEPEVTPELRTHVLADHVSETGDT
jgi:shikimate dehydrogenase